MNTPFELVDVRLGPIGGAEVNWSLHKDLPQPQPWQFQVQVALNPTAEWTTLKTVDATNWALTDPERYRWDMNAEIWYRVVLLDGKGGEHPSNPVRAGTVLPRRDRILAREVVRRALQRMRIRTGNPGWLYKRKQEGTMCPRCGDEITEQATNSQCEICLGTRIKGGFHDPVPYILEPQQGATLAIVQDDDASRRYRKSIPVAGIDFPHVDPYDLWADHITGRFWNVQPKTIQVSSSMRGMSLVIGMQIHPIPTKDVVYDQLPIPDPAEIPEDDARYFLVDTVYGVNGVAP